MSLGARGDKFGVVGYNLLKTGGFGDASTMGEKEIRVKLVGGDYVFYIMVGGVEKVIEKTRSIGRNYHGVDTIDENNFIFIPIQIDAAHTSVKLRLWGLNFPTFHYTELPLHNHGGQTFAAPDHVHTTPQHRHSFADTVTSGGGSAHNHSFTGSAGTTGNQSSSHNHSYQNGTYGPVNTGFQINSTNHTHSFTPSGSIGNESAHNHSVSVSGNTGYSTPTIDACTDSDALAAAGINGGTLNDTQKTVVDTLLNVHVTAVNGTWGTAKNYLTAGWESLADINDVDGTDEIDIFSYLTAGAFGYIKIAEPTAKKGGKIAWHISLS